MAKQRAILFLGAVVLWACVDHAVWAQPPKQERGETALNLDFEASADAPGVPEGWGIGGGEGYELASDTEVAKTGRRSGRIRYIGGRRPILAALDRSRSASMLGNTATSACAIEATCEPKKSSPGELGFGCGSTAPMGNSSPSTTCRTDVSTGRQGGNDTKWSSTFQLRRRRCVSECCSRATVLPGSMT